MKIKIQHEDGTDLIIDLADNEAIGEIYGERQDIDPDKAQIYALDIVKAVNMHDELINLLEKLYKNVDVNESMSDNELQEIEQLLKKSQA